MITQYDAIPEEFGNVPRNPQAVASYVDNYGGYNQAVSRWPTAHHLSITIYGNHARCADVEGHAMTPESAAQWFKDGRCVHLPTEKGVIYTSASNSNAVINAMNQRGIARHEYLLWSAHYGAGEHICSPGRCGYPAADGTQWADKVNGRSCDVSLLADDFFSKPPPPPDPYAIYPLNLIHKTPWGPLSEHHVVLQYDGARKHPLKYRKFLSDFLHPRLKYLAERVAYVAIHEPDHNGHPSWDHNNRGARYQGLSKRAAGKRLV